MEHLPLDANRTITEAVRGTSRQSLYEESGFLTLSERRHRRKVILYRKIINCNTPSYLEALLLALVSSVNPYHKRRLYERLIPPHKTELSSFFPSTTILWNTLPENIQSSASISERKRYLKRNDQIVLSNFYINIRDPQIIHTKLRLQISDLKQDLVKRHLSNEAACNYGTTSETVERYRLHCPHCIQARDITIHTLPPHYINIPILLNGDPTLPPAVDSSIFLTVQKFIISSNRFGVL